MFYKTMRPSFKRIWTATPVRTSGYGIKGKYVAKTTDMTQGRPAPFILKFALPIIAANVFQQIYGVVDNAIVGQWVGVQTLSRHWARQTP
jgi:O-antigen/teichoic acid export membrane protein